jgi:nucleotide-binding universal stress UspA family protein
MTLKNILVHVCSDARTTARLEIATLLARRTNACLVGVFGQFAQAEQVGFVITWPSKEYTDAVAAAKEMFEQATADLLSTCWHDINRGSESEILKQITSYSRYGDLMVFGQQGINVPDTVPRQIAEEVVIASGRPVLVVPRCGDFSSIGFRPLIVWTDTRESARALNDSLPLMEKGAEATLLVLANTDDEAQQSSLEVVRHLACHGIATKKEIYTQGLEEGAWELILSRIEDTCADLLVIGAHERIGFPFVSCEVVHKEATVPVITAS